MTDLLSSRHMLLDSIDNIRDLGGLETSDGRRTRSGLLFRSSMVHEISEQDAALLAQDLGVRLIMDLRSAGEIEQTGRGLLAAHIPAYINLPLFATDKKSVNLLPDDRLPTLALHYMGYLKKSSAQIAMAVRLLAHTAHLPVVFHCAAGKDRTGTLAAVVLSAIGVRDQEIIDDYALTNERLEYLLARMSRSEHYRHVVDTAPAYTRGAHAETMQQLLQHMQSELGGAEVWLKNIGVEESTLEQLRHSLLE
ncbi:MAG: tyrosine-protein phosphatase [Spongiibacteraceae bacterium]